MLWDGGSTLSFTIFKKAKALNLQGKPVKLGMEVVGGKVTLIDSKLYKFKILKENGQSVEIEAF